MCNKPDERLSYDRPLADAAFEVAATAAKAREMLLQIQSTNWWKLITQIKPPIK